MLAAILAVTFYVLGAVSTIGVMHFLRDGQKRGATAGDVILYGPLWFIPSFVVLVIMVMSLFYRRRGGNK